MTQPSTLLRSALFATAIASTLAFVGCSSSSMMAKPMMANSSVANFSATLSAASEVPPNSSTAKGTLNADLNKETKVLRWQLSYSGLTGPATMAHFHGPAMPGANAGVVVPFPSAASPSDGSATLTDSQIADLMAGKWYANIHTAANPGGEIRGQVMAK